MNNLLKIILITGMSGSGKSVALKALEDIGYYCIDNLPPLLIPQFINHISKTQYKYLAIAIDTRSGIDFENIPVIINDLKENKNQVDIIFLNASDEILIQRFSETRRPHPLTVNFKEKNLSQVIASEREYLSLMQDMGYNLDTSSLQSNKLRSWIQDVAKQNHTQQLLLTIQSFGFKYGLPRDVDFVFDVRQLPNPYYDKELKNLTGLDDGVKQFLEKNILVQKQIQDIRQYFDTWLPSFINNNRAYVTVGIGCTGGQHRSVYIAEQLSKALKYQHIILKHRQIS